MLVQGVNTGESGESVSTNFCGFDENKELTRIFAQHACRPKATKRMVSIREGGTGGTQ